jgi:hypothetical protein
MDRVYIEFISTLYRVYIEETSSQVLSWQVPGTLLDTLGHPPRRITNSGLGKSPGSGSLDALMSTIANPDFLPVKNLGKA